MSMARINDNYLKRLGITRTSKFSFEIFFFLNMNKYTISWLVNIMSLELREEKHAILVSLGEYHRRPH